jgi:hypothetical protein
MNKEEILKIKEDINDNNIDKIEFENSDKKSSEESDSSCIRIPIIPINEGLLGWTILFRYHQNNNINKHWYRKREDLLNEVVEDFNSQSAVIIPKCDKWMSFNAIIIIEIRNFS